jgi:hypothetical protein
VTTPAADPLTSHNPVLRLPEMLRVHGGTKQEEGEEVATANEGGRRVCGGGELCCAVAQDTDLGDAEWLESVPEMREEGKAVSKDRTGASRGAGARETK